MIVFVDSLALADPPRTERSIGPGQGFAVADLVEVLVELTHSHEPFGGVNCHDMISTFGELAHHLAVDDGRTDRRQAAHASHDVQGRNHGRSRGNAIVHNQHAGAPFPCLRDIALEQFRVEDKAFLLESDLGLETIVWLMQTAHMPAEAEAVLIEWASDLIPLDLTTTRESLLAVNENW